MTWDDAGLLVIAGGIAGQLKHLSAEVFKDSRQVNSSSDTNAGGILALLEVTTSTSNRELKTSTSALGASL